MQVSPDSKKTCIYEYSNIELVEINYIQEYLDNPNNYTMHQFSFDHVYDQESNQSEVYQNTAKPAVLSALEVFFKYNFYLFTFIFFSFQNIILIICLNSFFLI